jgi:hypothetical protein
MKSYIPKSSLVWLISGANRKTCEFATKTPAFFKDEENRFVFKTL